MLIYLTCSQLCVELPGKSSVKHKDACWPGKEAQWDTFPAQHHMATSASKLRQHLNRWQSPQYDFHWHDDPVPPPLVLYRKYHQDVIMMQATWEGLVVRTRADGSVDLLSERMGAGYAMADGLIPILALSAPVGGPLRLPLHQFDQRRLVCSKSCLTWQPTMRFESPC